MIRCTTLILIALLVAACGSSPAATPGSDSTRVVGEEAAQATLAQPAPPTAAPTEVLEPSLTSTPGSTATSAATAKQRSLPSATPKPGITPTPELMTRSQDGMSMVFVPAGDFIMGNLLGMGSDEEAPPHRVTLDGYWIDRTEVTNAQYRAFVDATGSPVPSHCSPEDQTYRQAALADHPVACVSWDEAQAYCAWAGGRLPTEAEWEKAARGLDERAYPWGERFDGSLANFCDASCELSDRETGFDDGYARTAPVGSYPAGASPYGALDMAGNVWEWVGDWYSFLYYGMAAPLNPQGPSLGDERVLRGGAWNAYPTNLRTGFRAWLAPGKGDRVIGFRCVVPAAEVP